MQSSKTAAYAAAAAAAAAMAYVAWRRSAAARINRAGKAVVPLMRGETSAIMMDVPAISTVTFFEGKHAAAEAAAATFLRKRLAHIVGENPWLMGVLDHQRGDERPVLVVPGGPSGDELFRHAAPGEVVLHRSMPYPSIVRAVAPLLVKKGNLCVGRSHEPLFRVSVVPDAAEPDRRWALVVSLSHVIADGHTFYRIYNMLCDAEPVAALDVQRKASVPDAAAEAMGPTNAGFLQFPKPGLLVKVVIAMVAGKLFGPAGGVAVYEVDAGFVSRKKREAKAEASVPFVSTNDVITSSVLTASGCDIGTMDINFRGRIAGCDDSDAGNYEDKIVYRSADFESPSLVRRSILSAKALHRAAEPPTELPTSVLDFIRSGTIAFVTNWASFARDVALPAECRSKEDMHLPLFGDPAEVPVRAFAGCCIFRAAHKRLGILLLGQPAALDAIACCGIAGRMLNVGGM